MARATEAEQGKEKKFSTLKPKKKTYIRSVQLNYSTAKTQIEQLNNNSKCSTQQPKQ